MRQTSNIKIEQYVLYLMYPTVILVQFFMMFGYQVNLFLHIPVLLLFIFFSIKKIKRCALNDFKEHNIMFLYFLYVLISIIWYRFNGIPIAAYIGNLKLFVLPMLFYFWGADKNDTSDRFYNIFLVSITITIVVSLYLYFTLPSFYVSYMLDVKQESAMASQWHNESNIMDNARFSGIFKSSYAISYMGMSAFCIALSNFINKRLNYSNASLIVMILVLVTGIVLCMQRIAWGMLFLYVSYFIFCVGFKQKKTTALFVLFITILLIVATNTGLFFSDRYADVNTLIGDRLKEMNLQKAMGARQNQYDIVDWLSIDRIFGNGLGSGGYYATVILGEEGVTDGEYIKQVMEFGYVGLLLLFSLVITSFLKVRKNYKCFILELFIAVYFLAAGIGHNSLNSYFYTYIFWYVMGRLNNKTYREQIIMNS